MSLVLVTVVSVEVRARLVAGGVASKVGGDTKRLFVPGMAPAGGVD